jgi:hypothetical protein
VRILCSRALVAVASGLLTLCLGSLSGCDGKPADGTLVEAPQISADQQAEVQAQYKRQMLERQKKAAAKGTAGRRRGGN